MFEKRKKNRKRKEVIERRNGKKGKRKDGKRGNEKRGWKAEKMERRLKESE